MRFFLIFAAFLSSALGSGIPPSATDIATGNNVASDAAAANCTGPLNCPGMVMIFDKDGYKGNLQYMISMYNLNHYFKDNADCYAIRQNFLSSVFLKTRLGRKHWGCWMYSETMCRGESFWFDVLQQNLGLWNKRAKSMKCYMD